jgi:hypothetical protein
MRLLSGWKLECLEQGAETRRPEEQQLCEGECLVSARRAGLGASDERKRQRQRMASGL